MKLFFRQLVHYFTPLVVIASLLLTAPSTQAATASITNLGDGVYTVGQYLAVEVRGGPKDTYICVVYSSPSATYDGIRDCGPGAPVPVHQNGPVTFRTGNFPNAGSNISATLVFMKSGGSGQNTNVEVEKISLPGTFTVKTAQAQTGTPKMTVSDTSVESDEWITFSLNGGTAGAKFCVYTNDESQSERCQDAATIESDGTAEIRRSYDMYQTTTFEFFGLIQNANGTTTQISGSQKVTVSGSGSPTPTPKPTEVPKTGVKECDDMANPPTIQNGSQGSAVVCLQRRLTQEGLTVEDDGRFGPKTEAAVRSYQNDNGLKSDGIVGPATWSALLGRVIGGNPQTPGTTPTPTPTKTGGGNGDVGECNDIGLEKVNGLCLPKGRPTGSGLISCQTVGDCLSRVIKILLTLAAVIAVVFIIIGGYQYMTSAGNEEQSGKGKKTLLYAIIGLGAVILAYTIVTIVFNALTRDSIL